MMFNKAGAMKIGWLIAILPFAGVTFANQCDCTQTIGPCQGTIRVNPTGEAKGLYGADLVLSANASQCAKIEYWVDNTPAMTLLPNGNYAEDRIMGTSIAPVLPDRITYKSCTVCKTTQQITAEARENERAARERAQLIQDTANKVQAEIDKLVADATNSGALEPSTYYSSPYGEPADITTSVLQLQQQLIDMSNEANARAAQAELKLNAGAAQSEIKNNRRSYPDDCGTGPYAGCR